MFFDASLEKEGQEHQVYHTKFTFFDDKEMDSDILLNHQTSYSELQNDLFSNTINFNKIIMKLHTFYYICGSVGTGESRHTGEWQVYQNLRYIER